MTKATDVGSSSTPSCCPASRIYSVKLLVGLLVEGLGRVAGGAGGFSDDDMVVVHYNGRFTKIEATSRKKRVFSTPWVTDGGAWPRGLSVHQSYNDGFLTSGSYIQSKTSSYGKLRVRGNHTVFLREIYILVRCAAAVPHELVLTVKNGDVTDVGDVRVYVPSRFKAFVVALVFLVFS